MRAVVLNLARRPERLRRFLEWNGGHGLDVQVAAAIDGTALDRAALVAEGVLAEDSTAFTDGALGNALSHRAQWLACAEEDKPRLVCEDDACLHASLPAQLPHLAAALNSCDLLYVGFNTNAPVAMLLPDQMVVESYFGTAGPRGPDHYHDYATSTAPRDRSAVHRALMVWGTIAYVVSPAGARRLLDTCFPLSGTGGVRFHVERKQVPPTALDGVINLAMQAGHVRGGVCFPPLAISPNNWSDVS